MSATRESWPDAHSYSAEGSVLPVVADEPPQAADAALVGDDEGRRGYTRSTVAFPYADLDDTVRIAEVIHGEYGGRCSLDQLAASLGQSMKSGSFRTKVSSAQMFGIIDNERGRLVLTPRGRRVVDEKARGAALAEAFLSVGLYHTIFQRYQGSVLPPDRGLEAEMANLGVAPKQAERARQAFQRSAETAGFFRLGRDRLVAPPHLADSDIVSGMAPQSVVPVREPAPATPAPSTHLHPLLEGLMRELPAEGETFPAEKREDWLEAAQVIFRLVYGKDETSRRGQVGSSEVHA